MGLYIYVMGGSDGTKAVNSTRRAMILNPREVPQLDVDDIVPAANGLDAGYWFYRVATTFDVTDTDNPLGESLASDEFIVKVPVFPGKKIQVVLKWAAPVDSLGVALPHVSGYRVYRTAAVNGSSGQEVLLTTTAAGTLTYTDDATLTPGVANPLPLGSTGKWATLPNLNTARKGAAGAAAFDPTVAGQFYVYDLLGLDATNTALTSYEYLTVTTGANEHQTVVGNWDDWREVGRRGYWSLSAGRLGRGCDNGQDHHGTHHLRIRRWRFGRGRHRGEGSAGWQGPDWRRPWRLVDTPSDFNNTIAGYGVCSANGQLFTFGGLQATPSAGAKFCSSRQDLQSSCAPSGS